MKKILLLMVALFTLGGGAMNAQTKTTLEQLKAANGLDEDWVASVPAAYPLDVKDAVLFGSDASAQVTNADVSKYDYIYFEVKNFTSARAVRVFFWDPTANKRIDYFLKPVADKETADYAANTTVTGNGTYCVQIPAGARLQGAKTPWTSTGATEPYFQFSEIYLTERPVEKTTLEKLNAANGSDADWVASVPAAYPLDVKDAVLFGSDASAQATNADVSKYDYIYFEVKNFTSARAVRVFFWDPTANKRIDYFLKPVADKETADYAANTTVAGNGTYCVQIPAGARLQGAKTPWTSTAATEPYFQFSEIYLTEREVSYIEATELFEAPAGTTDLNGMKGSGNNVVWDVTYPQKLGNETNWCGDIDSDNKSVDITNYDYLHFVVSSVSDDAHVGLRVFVSKGTNVKDERTILYPHPIAEAADVKNWTETSWITAPGTYVVKISYNNDTHLRGFKTLQGWNQNAGTITVSQAYLSSDAPVDYLSTGKYVLVGDVTGSPSLDAALADANAKIYDATGVTATGLELTPANPNAIFVANEGALSNNQNVCVNGNINSLSLTDGHPFKAPAGATASNANYSRENMNKWGTVCLPYAVTSSESAQFYSIDGIDGDVLKVTALDNVPAGVPALVNVTNGAFAVSARDVELSDVKVSNSTTPLYGTYEYKDITADDAANYYAISNNQFVQATGKIELGAFRAYFTAPKSSPANLRIPAGETTAIEALTGEGDATVVGIYSANGAQQRSLQKGINVIKLSNGKTQKVLVK